MNGGKMAVLSFEIDRYDEYNRSFGQKVTDIIAKMVAKTLAGNLQSYDFVGRWSDKEFIVFLTNTQLENYIRVAERLCTLVSRSSDSITKNTLHVTVSGGAYSVAATDSKESIIDRVKKLTRKSTVSGGNRVTAQPNV